MKKLAFLALLLFSIPAVASDYYIGVGTGISKTNYDVRDDLKEEKYYPLVDILGVDLTDDMKDTATSIFVGKALSDTWALELGHTKFGMFKAKASLGYDVDYEDHHADIKLGANAKINSEVLSLSLLGTLNPEDKFKVFSRVGASYFVGDIVGGTQIVANVDDKHHAKYDRDTNRIRGVAPHLGLGVQFNMNKGIAFRVEAVRYGNVYEGINIETLTANILVTL